MDVFRDHPELNQFELLVGDHMAYAKYHVEGQTLYIDYVEAPLALRGSGAASRLMAQIMTFARDGGYTVVPICGYAAAWIQRHSD